MRYFPFLRGKQFELKALKELATNIAEHGGVIPIVEPVNSNTRTQKALDEFLENEMRFVFIDNSTLDDFSGDGAAVIRRQLRRHQNWIPAFHINGNTQHRELSNFISRYDPAEYYHALIYGGWPLRDEVLSVIQDMDFEHHIFVKNWVAQEYTRSIPPEKRVFISDSFRRQVRNADYPSRDFFTDLNTLAGNPENIDFGDFSIVGDHYTKGGGGAHAVALHHIHFGVNSTNELLLSHFKSDRTDSLADTPGKTPEAVDHLVEALDELYPDTEACNHYLEMAQTRTSHSLGYMKYLAIKHHLEVMLCDGGLEAQPR